MTKPSLKAVAKIAGVSPSTVSNAYNKPGQMSEAVRERVLRVAADLGYPGPNPSASSLRSRRTGSIGMLFAQELTYAFSDPYCTELLSGVAEVVSESGINVVLMPVGPHVRTGGHSRDEELHLLQGVRRAALDGVIADGVDAEHPALRVLAERGIPVVTTTPDVGDRCVLVDDRDAGLRLGRYLGDLGHRRVAALADSLGTAGPRVGVTDTGELFPYSRLRIEGLREALGPDGDVVTVAAGANTIGSGAAATTAVLAAGSTPTAIVATTDLLALGALEALREAGTEPGTQLAVTGFDDIPQAAAAGLTTVRQPVREKGRTMARMLTDPSAVQGSIVTLPTEIIIRTTAGRARETPSAPPKETT